MTDHAHRDTAAAVGAGGLGGLLRRLGARLTPWQQWTLLAVAGLAALGLVLVVGAAVAFAWVYATAAVPTPGEIEPPTPTVLLADDGQEVATLEPTELPRAVDLDDLPDHVLAAVLAAEDRRFHEHRGFSVSALARAAWNNLRAGEIREGGSTIHQQYVSLAVDGLGRNLPDKFREIAIAARLNAEVDKDDVLEAYLEHVPLGRTARGIEAGARVYFGVEAAELDLEQAALLAGLIAAPTAYDPADDPEGAAARRDYVVGGMHEMGAITGEEAEAILDSPLPEVRDAPVHDFGDHTYFLDVVRERVPHLVGDRVAVVEEDLVVHTTLDERAQGLLLDELASALEDEEPTGAAVTIESDSGAVRALAGGTDWTEERFNVAVDGFRQAGSAFKTFALAQLVAQGHDPDETVVDAPRTRELPGEDGETITVHNFDGEDHGEVSVREATVDSINTAYVNLAEELGGDRVAAAAAQLGVRTELPDSTGVVLGIADVRPLELTAAYATLAAEGTRHTPHLVERIERRGGEVLYEHEPEGEEVLDPDLARVVTDVLVDVVDRGTGTAADLDDHATAGKTGTSDEFRDAWFVGYTTTHTTGIWVGNLDNSPMEEELSGGSVPAEIFAAYMGSYLEDVDTGEFEEPDASVLDALEGLGDGDGEDDEDGEDGDEGDDQEDGEDDDREGQEDREDGEDGDDGSDDAEGEDGDAGDEDGEAEEPGTGESDDAPGDDPGDDESGDDPGDGEPGDDADEDDDGLIDLPGS